MTTVYLVRHAEAEGNVYRRCHGQYDSLLTPRGVEQLASLAERFSETHLDAIYASDLYRARTTAHAVADPKGMSVRLRPLLREIDMGEWEDKTWAELSRTHPAQYAHWQIAHWNCVTPHGESPMQAGARMLGEVRQLAAQHEGQIIAIFAHGTVIRMALSMVRGLAPEDSGEIGWGDNTCVAKLLFEESKDTVEFWNDASHVPLELSTFRSIGWKDDKAAPTSPQLWFCTVDLQDATQRASLLYLAQQKHMCAYGSLDGFDEANFLSDTQKMLDVSERAVTFGMLDDTPAALVRLNVCDTTNPNIGMVGSFIIDEPYRGQGLFQQIVGQTISVYRALGKDALCALVSEHNERALHFYRKYGFTQNGKRETSTGNYLCMYRQIAVKSQSIL